MIRYTVYALKLLCGEPLAGLQPSHWKGQADCECHFNISPPGPLHLEGSSAEVIHSGDPDENGIAAVHVRRSVDGAYFGFFYRDGTTFVMSSDGRQIWCNGAATQEDAATYLLGPILAFVLRIRGTLALHASAVAVDDRAVLFTAAGGGGKSTIAAAFALRGYRVISDDVVAIALSAESFFAIPGYARVRLWSDSADALYGSPEALPLLTSTWSKRYLSLEGGTFESRTLPIAAVYRLTDPTQKANLKRLHGHEAAMAVVTNSSVAETLSCELRVNELDQVAAFTSRIPVFRLAPASGLDRVDAVCDLVLESLRSIQ